MLYKLIFCLLMPLVLSKCERTNTAAVKTYKINLDSPPAERFAEVTADFKKEILILFDAER